MNLVHKRIYIQLYMYIFKSNLYTKRLLLVGFCFVCDFSLNFFLFLNLFECSCFFCCLSLTAVVCCFLEPQIFCNNLNSIFNMENWKKLHGIRNGMVIYMWYFCFWNWVKKMAFKCDVDHLTHRKMVIFRIQYYINVYEENTHTQVTILKVQFSKRL